MTTRPESFVIFPGDAGVFHQRDDTNLLDADTAHIFQSIGGWANAGSAVSLQAVDESEAFSGKALQWECGSDTRSGVFQDSTKVPIQASTQYHFSEYFKAGATGGIRYLRIRWFDSGEALITETNIDSETITDTGRNLLQAAATSPSNAAFVSIRTDCTGVAVGVKLEVSDIQIAEGGEQSFVPSLRIVGDVELLIDYAPADVDDNGELIGLDPASVYGVWQSPTSAPPTLRWYSQHGSGPASLPIGDHGLADGQRGLIRVTRELSSGLVTGYVDDVSIGTATAKPGEPFDYAGGANFFGVGRFGLGQGWLAATVFGAEARDGIGGPPVALWLPDEILGGAVP